MVETPRTWVHDHETSKVGVFLIRTNIASDMIHQKQVFSGKVTTKDIYTASQFWSPDSWFPMFMNALRGASLWIQYFLIPLE